MVYTKPGIQEEVQITGQMQGQSVSFGGFSRKPPIKEMP